MTSRGHVIFVHVDQSVTLDCEFRARRFSLFDNPIVWTKTQRAEERTQVNILSNIVEPFLDTGRLSVAFVSAATDDVYRMSLRIRGTIHRLSKPRRLPAPETRQNSKQIKRCQKDENSFGFLLSTRVARFKTAYKSADVINSISQ